eukprot:scaffold22601_cov50-Phaeocystis_antarctica.AAC.1
MAHVGVRAATRHPFILNHLDGAVLQKQPQCARGLLHCGQALALCRIALAVGAGGHGNGPRSSQNARVERPPGGTRAVRAQPATPLRALGPRLLLSGSQHSSPGVSLSAQGQGVQIKIGAPIALLGSNLFAQKAAHKLRLGGRFGVGLELHHVRYDRLTSRSDQARPLALVHSDAFITDGCRTRPRGSVAIVAVQAAWVQRPWPGGTGRGQRCTVGLQGRLQ